jgi:hypothetical protein
MEVDNGKKNEFISFVIKIPTASNFSKIFKCNADVEDWCLLLTVHWDVLNRHMNKL